MWVHGTSAGGAGFLKATFGAGAAWGGRTESRDVVGGDNVVGRSTDGLLGELVQVLRRGCRRVSSGER